MMNVTSAPSTITKIAAVKAKMNQYAWVIRRPFGVTGDSGSIPPLVAHAALAKTRAPSRSSMKTSRFLPTSGGILIGLRMPSRVQLPPHVTAPFEVYLNGVRQLPGRDFRHVGDTLVFDRELAEEGRLGFVRWASMLLGIAGTYRRNDTVDVVYQAVGRRQVATGLRFEPLGE